MRRCALAALAVLAVCGLAATVPAGAKSGNCLTSESATLAAFAKEGRLSQVERTAVTGLVAQLRAQPRLTHGVCGAVNSATVTITVKSASPPVGTPDMLCLRALLAIGMVQHLPGFMVTPTTRLAAVHVLDVVTAAEKRGRTMCTPPTR